LEIATFRGKESHCVAKPSAHHAIVWSLTIPIDEEGTSDAYKWVAVSTVYNPTSIKPQQPSQQTTNYFS
jgi:hypothetical protein